MKALTIIHAEITIQSLTEAKKRAKGMQAVLRCLALELVLEGKKHQDICTMLKLGQNTVSQCIARVNSRGLAGLRVAKGRGRKASLTTHQKQALK